MSARIWNRPRRFSGEWRPTPPPTPLWAYVLFTAAALCVIGGCVDDAPLAGVTTSTPDTSGAASQETGENQSCEAILALLDALATIPDGLEAAQLAERVRSLSEDVSGAAARVSPAAAVDGESVASFFWQLSGDFERLSFARADVAPRTAALMDDVVETAAPYLRSLADARGLRLVMPAVAEACAPPLRPASTTAYVRFTDALAAFADTDVGQRPAFAGLAALAAAMVASDERSTAGPSSGMDADYDACATDPSATEPGSNAGCDALLDSCMSGQMFACNDLYWISPLGSEYESMAATCGSRVDWGHAGFGGFCDEIHGD